MGLRKGEETGRYPLCKKEEWTTYTSEMQRDKNMERTIFTQKWPQINEETVYRKLVSNTKILELRTLGTFLYI
jgi:hypothetical protein